MTQTQILSRLRELLADTFEIDPARVTPEADLYRDLDLDSIDAVDLAIKLQEMTGKRIKPDEFRSVRTVNDVMAAVDRLLAAS
ncbi:MAG: acyl carrier protein [Burkholderiales bacterium]